VTVITRFRWLRALSSAACVAWSVPAHAQAVRFEALRPEVFASVGRAFLIEGETLTGGASVGVGLTLPIFPRLSARVEVSRMLGTSVDTFTGVRLRCPGGVCGPSEPFEYRSGTSSLTAANAGLLFYFSERRLRPFLGGGLSLLWREGAVLCATFCRDPDAYSEDFRKTDMKGFVSTGLRIVLSQRVSVTPELQIYNARDYGVIRPSIAAGVHW
jgi:hypothetical protein